ncbi:YggS family pyridoxal phosphate-dependent enzyme [Ectobacillus sp. sgz5001026]|uniref:YggS family pyridoxal phosphate-dependent enzyme n=1 Tax=Ectobacillus sp. sgz5001026 TaxID=3242473 RepID=UPI0036D298C1
MTVLNHLEHVTHEIEQACKKVNRLSSEVTIIAVTKTVGDEKTKEVLHAGLTHLAENRVEGFLHKHEVFGHEASWHYIGSLQTRKVKEIINKIDYLHSLDRISLAEEIQKRAEKTIRCFVQVKTSSEESKHGLNPQEAILFVKELEAYDKINVVGLMTMAPYTNNEDEIRSCFHALKSIQSEIHALHLPYAPCTELSMGMSNDYTIAIEEGATFIRLGTILVA